VQFQNRVLVFVQWGFQYLTFSRGARLITGYRDLPKYGQVEDVDEIVKV
jgi:NADH:ubiquinone reductase (H+-translocating)